jgi:hypothetical protein
MSEFEDNLWQEVLTEHGHELARLEVPPSYPSGRARARVLAGTAAAGAGVALVLGVTGVLGTARTHPTIRTLAPGTIRTAAFTLRHNQDGTDTLTLNPGELFDPAQLQSDLAQYGIPAKVTSGSYCTSDPAPAGFSQVVSVPGSPPRQPAAPAAGEQPTITIDPSAMPDGTELSFGNFQLTSSKQQADLDLIDTNSFTCTSTPPALGANAPGFGAQYWSTSDGGYSIQLAPGSN